MKKRFFAVIAAALVVTTALVAGDTDKDQKALQGKWVGVIDGKEDVELVIKGNQWSLRTKDDRKSFKGTFKLDAKSTPHGIDMNVEDGMGDDAAKYKGKTSLGIYELKGDTLRWCAHEPGQADRPTEFTEKKALLVEFKRAK